MSRGGDQVGKLDFGNRPHEILWAESAYKIPGCWERSGPQTIADDFDGVESRARKATATPA
jgi:hypothetical protein